MGLTREQKRTVVSKTSGVASTALSALVADYKGLSAGEITSLRASARLNAVHVQVVRNTLARRAVEGTRFECLGEVLTGPTLLAFSQTDPGAPARLFKSFIKGNEHLKVKGLSLGGSLLSPDRLNEVSSLPTYLGAVASFLSALKAPVSLFVRTCALPYTQLVRLLAVLGGKKRAIGYGG